MNSKIWLSSPHMGGDELRFINEAFTENWIAPLGPNVDNFEKDIASYANVKAAAALSAGTAALHLGLILLGVEAHDEVLCSTFTFSASANPIMYQGAVPVFVESEPDTWNMCPQALEDAIVDRIKKGKKPKAIILVHLYGQPAKVEEIMQVTNKYEIPVLEDAAESLGATVNGRMTGTFGAMGVYSFNGNKIITTSGGGALVSNNEDYVNKSRFLATQARDNAPHYQHSQVGYNYRMSNIIAGIGRGQMKVLDLRIQQRRSVFDFYKKELSGFEGISFLEEYNGTFANRWLTTIVVDSPKTDRETIRLALNELNIESRPLWKPMHQQPVFEKYPYYGDRLSERLFERGLCLPSGSNLTNIDLERVAEGIKKML